MKDIKVLLSLIGFTTVMTNATMLESINQASNVSTSLNEIDTQFSSGFTFHWKDTVKILNDISDNGIAMKNVQKKRNLQQKCTPWFESLYDRFWRIVV